MSHCASSKLLALFSMPGLEHIAEPFSRYIPEEKAVALVGYLGGRTATRSAAALDSELAYPGRWDDIRRTAWDVARRRLPKDPPTFDQLRHLRDKIGAELPSVAVEMSVILTIEALCIARAAGLAVPRPDVDVLSPTRENTIVADGSWFAPLSDVKHDPKTGELVGSRHKDVLGPRLSAVQAATKNGVQLLGLPFVFASVRGDLPLQRVVLGYRRFANELLSRDRAEAPAAAELLTRVITAAEGGILFCVYDMAFTGDHLNRLARHGVVGAAAMKQAESNTQYLTVGDDGPTSYNNDTRKVRLRSGGITTTTHRVNDQWCDHALSGVDGSPRTHPTDRPPATTDPLCELVALDFDGPPGRHHLHATYLVPCPHGGFERRIELTGNVDGTRIKVLNRIRPFHEYDPRFKLLKGWRQDIESLHATTKHMLPIHGRASSLDLVHFELDVLGLCLAINAQCWDEHVAQLSPCANESARLRRNTAFRHPRKPHLQQEDT